MYQPFYSARYKCRNVALQTRVYTWCNLKPIQTDLVKLVHHFTSVQKKTPKIKQKMPSV